MRKLNKGTVITAKALKRHPQMILTDLGRNLIIENDAYTDSIPFAQWRFWHLRKKGGKYSVLKSIPL